MGPTLFAFGSQAQKNRFLPPIRSGIGVAADYDLGRFHKRVLTWNRLFGDANQHLGRIARSRAGATTTEFIG